MTDTEICFLPAVKIVELIKSKQLSCRELMEIQLKQIEKVNSKVNAVVTLLEEKGIKDAEEFDNILASGKPVGPLHGIPVTHKDMFLTKGIRTTFGSPLFSDFVPKENSLIIERMQSAGAITIGKNNTPEFGAGSQTYNEVFGQTLNPYDTTKTCGGSSGGAAVALACGMQSISDGSDTGGSLRNPANFCNVVGFRPSPGRVPVWPSQMGWDPISVHGPMARTVEDIALLLSVIAGPDPRVPNSISEPGNLFSQPLQKDFKGTKIAWSNNLGGLPIDPVVNSVLNSQKENLENLGCTVIEDEPDFTNADRAFKIWRGWAREIGQGELLRKHRKYLKKTLAWDIEQGVTLTGPEIGWAETERMSLFQRMHSFFKEYDYFICPVSQVPPFNVQTTYITEIQNEKMETFIDWMKSCYYITLTGCPSISVPAGFTPSGLPIGMQIVGKYRDDLGVLQLAHAFEQITEFWKIRPEVTKL